MDYINYTKMDYLTGSAPYEEVENCDNPFEKEQKITLLAEHAKSVGVKNFKTLHAKYVKTVRNAAGKEYFENASNFTGQEIELNTGTWTADDYGIVRDGYQGQEEVACSHPIMPIMRMTNIDSGIEKLKLAFQRGGVWKSIVCDRKQVASQSSVINLADYGVSVTSENARYMVKYLNDVENLNYERIPERKSVSRLGWIDGAGFSPYVEGLEFDGEDSFRSFFDSVKQVGSEDAWLELAKQCRAYSSTPFKIALAASFASVLVKPCGGLPFFVHLWGETGTGKSVGMMFAASVWANPEMGKYIHTFNSTAVAQELSAGFVNSLPLMLDELQIIKDKKDFDQMIYQLTEGVGRSRGHKTGGLQRTETWSNCIITTAEQPISNGSSGGGAINRVVEIHCKDKLIEKPAEVLKVIKSNYGHAGRRFVEILSEPGMLKNARDIQSTFFRKINQSSTEKQALAASLILTADFLINEHIFRDGRCISFEELQQFLSDKDSVCQEKRAYEWLQGWIAQNRNKFISSGREAVSECYGRIDAGSVNIIRGVFNSACQNEGYNPSAFAIWLRDNGLTDTSGTNRTDKKVRIDGSPCWCICLRTDVEFVEVPEDEQVEF